MFEKVWLVNSVMVSFNIVMEQMTKISQQKRKLSLGVHLPIWSGTFKVSNRKYIIKLFISKYSKKIKDLLKIQWTFVILLSLFVIRNFRIHAHLLKCMVRERLEALGPD